MTRFVLLYVGKGKKPTADVQAIKAIKGITVIDESDGNAMIVEGKANVKKSVNAMPNWVADKVTFIPAPKTGPFF